MVTEGVERWGNVEAANSCFGSDEQTEQRRSRKSPQNTCCVSATGSTSGHGDAGARRARVTLLLDNLNMCHHIKGLQMQRQRSETQISQKVLAPLG